ncbi:MAG TPA: reverse transcriptase domain-containing protein [Planctomycetota bacterium]|nr:reverse transcriptase domain-containing protein [Planctomycetota bacterium]
MIFAEPPRSRQDLYERIQKTSKDAVVLDEMIRHGFWPDRGTLPQDPAEEIHRRAELQKRLSELRTQLVQTRNEERLRAELRKKRLEESKKKQAETKLRREQERKKKAEHWQAVKATEIVYLGEGVSGGLGKKEADDAALAKRGLPLLHSAAEVAQAAGITVGQLRFLCFSRRVSRVSHYKTFKIKKKTGGERAISAPMPRLKAFQRWILESVLDKVALHANAHGFRHGRSILSNASPHAGAGIVVNVDLKDFFPSIRYGRVKGMFRWLGYSEEVATIFALACTATDVDEVTLDGTKWFVASSVRRLPQGAPTSPAVTNVLCDRLDRRLTNAATKLGFTYTRYADDLSFSAKPGAEVDPGKLLRRVKWLVTKDGLEVHPDKTRILRRGRRQEVTGLVVNKTVSVPRDELRRFRALLHQIDKQGPKGKRWGDSDDVLASIDGFANYVLMIDKAKGEKLKARVTAIHKKYSYVKRVHVPKKPAAPAASPRVAPIPAPMPMPPPSAPEPPASAPPPSASPPVPPPAPGEEPPKKKPWWKLW